MPLGALGRNSCVMAALACDVRNDVRLQNGTLARWWVSILTVNTSMHTKIKCLANSATIASHAAGGAVHHILLAQRLKCELGIHPAARQI